MAVQIIDSGNRIERTSNVVSAASNYTCIFWYNLINKIQNNYNVFLTVDDLITYSQLAAIYGDGGIAEWVQWNTNDGFSTNGTVFDGLLKTNQWLIFAYTRSGTTQSFYINGILIGTSTYSLSTSTFNHVLLGDDGTNDGNVQQFCNFREWNVALSGAQILAEINSPSSVVHTANLVTFTPLTSDLLDISGNGNNWTAVGSPTFVSNPLPPVTGSLFIPSDHFDSVKGSATIIDSSTGALLTTLPFVTADQGGRLSSGIWALAAQVSSSSGNVNAVNVYDTGFDLVGSVSIANWFSPAFTASKNFFYIQNPSTPFTVEQITSVGVLSGKSWALSAAADAIAVTDDDSILYWIDGLTIKAFDLINNIALPDILTLPVVQVGGQIIVVNTNQFVICVSTVGNLLNWHALRYDNTGTLLFTYPTINNAGVYDAPEIFLDIDLTKFWMRAFDQVSDVTSTWYKFNISDGTVATTFTTPDMDGGGTIPTTCPVIPMGSLPTGMITVGKASPQTNSQTFTMTVGGTSSSTFTIGFQGTQILNLAPGTYSIVEIPDPNYNPQYLISNDPVNNNNLAIVVNNGDNLSVVIVNNLSTKYGGLYQLVPGKTNDTVKNQDGSNIQLMINWFWKLFIARDK